jgi:ABC-type glycerol-3-phosphate transport system permease component
MSIKAQTPDQIRNTIAPKKLRKKYTFGHRISRATGYTILFLLTLSSIFPLVWMILMSLKDRSETYSGNFLPSKVTLSAYQFVFQNLDITRYLWNSVKITQITVAVVIRLCLCAH